MTLHGWRTTELQEVTDHCQRRVVTGEDLLLAWMELQHGATAHPHAHPNAEVVIVLSGALRFDLPNREVTLYPNETLLIPAGLQHASEALKETSAVFICLPPRDAWLEEESQALYCSAEDALWGV